MRDLYEQNSPSHLLIVGHTDTTAEPSINDPLSVARAKSVQAYLVDDVDTWLQNYDASGKGKWGAREDRLMITAMPDFSLRTPDEDLISWFQRTRALTVDGKAGPQTRKQLITEYMALDATSLKDDEQFQIDITTHGCGENFPLDETGLELDQAAANGKEDALDRRVELFFFDEDFGILPKPAAASGKQYLEWRKAAAENHDFAVAGIGRKATFFEVQDALFRTNSCVVLPEGEAPSADEQRELGETKEGVTALREQLVWVDDSRKALGFSEHHPVDKIGRDGFRSQANRRVELLNFDLGEEPDLELAESDPDVSDLYLPGNYQRNALPLRANGLFGPLLEVSVFVGNGNESDPDGELLVLDQTGTIVQTIQGKAADQASDGYCVFRFPPGTLPDPCELRWETSLGTFVLAGSCASNCAIPSTKISRKQRRILLFLAPPSPLRIREFAVEVPCRRSPVSTVAWCT
jgi:hypothetical protein